MDECKPLLAALCFTIWAPSAWNSNSGFSACVLQSPSGNTFFTFARAAAAAPPAPPAPVWAGARLAASRSALRLSCREGIRPRSDGTLRTFSLQWATGVADTQRTAHTSGCFGEESRREARVLLTARGRDAREQCVGEVVSRFGGHAGRSEMMTWRAARYRMAILSIGPRGFYAQRVRPSPRPPCGAGT